VRYYIKKHGTLSSAPRISILSSWIIIISFIIGYYNNEVSGIDFIIENIVLVLIVLVVLIFTLMVYWGKRESRLMKRFLGSVIEYKIVEKYNTEPKWAIYIYSDNGTEGWCEAIPGSYMAKDPVNDLTFVHATKEKAENYARRMYKNAVQIT